MHSVQKAFGGLYKEVNRETQQWYTDTSPVPEPRPGTVRTPGCLCGNGTGQPLSARLLGAQLPVAPANLRSLHSASPATRGT